MSRRLIAAVAFMLATAAGHARADLVLNYSGVTDVGSTDTTGSAIATGTQFEIHATFDSTPPQTGTGLGLYTVTAIDVLVGGTSYVADTSGMTAEFIDPSEGLFGSVYFAILNNDNYSNAFAPGYLTATPAIDATAVSATVFSDYLGSIAAPGLTLSTASGDLFLTYDNAVGIAASITGSAVPGPSSVLLFGTGVLGLIRFGRRRRSAA